MPILLKVRLTEEQVRSYRQPEGTRNPECGGGINCMFCTLKMLQIYSPEYADFGDVCMPRYKSGHVITIQEHLNFIQRITKDMFHADHTFTAERTAGRQRETLEGISAMLAPGEACFGMYGNSNNGGHAIVFRKGDDGVLELIDPQRSTKDIGKSYGFTPERAKELGLEVTANYYRVRGTSGIEEVMIEQSVLFEYWPSKEAVLADLNHFYIGRLEVDSVIGLAMLIPAGKMEVDEQYGEKMQIDEPVGQPMEVDGGARGGPQALRWDKHVLRVPPNTKLTPDAMQEGLDATDDAVYAELVKGLEDLIAYAPDASGESRPKFFYITEDEPEGEIEEEKTEEEDALTGGIRASAESLNRESQRERIEKLRERMRGRLESRVGTATVATREAERNGWQKLDTEMSGRMKRVVSMVEGKYPDLVSKTFMRLKYGSTDDTMGDVKSPAFRDLPRILWEDPPAFGQCSAIDKLKGTAVSGKNCWLCGNEVKMFAVKPRRIIGEHVFTICDPAPNGEDCEHILPAWIMMFLGLVYTRKLKGAFSAADLEFMRELYDTSCHTCNGTKSDTLYIQGDPGIFEPNIVNIMTDLICFVTTISKTSASKKTPLKTKCADGSEGLTTGTSVAMTNQFTFTSIVSVVPMTAVSVTKYPNLIRAFIGIEEPPALEVAENKPLRKLARAKHLLDDLRSVFTKRDSEENLTLVEGLPSKKATIVHLDESGPMLSLPGDTGNVANRLAKTLIDTGKIAHIKRSSAIKWILKRFIVIYDRMKKICKILNAEPWMSRWLNRYDLLATHSVVGGPTGSMPSALEKAIPKPKLVKPMPSALSKAMIVPAPVSEAEISEMEGQKYPIEPPPTSRKRKAPDSESEASEMEGQKYPIEAEPPASKRKRVLGGAGEDLTVVVQRAGRRVIHVVL